MAAGSGHKMRTDCWLSAGINAAQYLTIDGTDTSSQHPTHPVTTSAIAVLDKMFYFIGDSFHGPINSGH